MSNSTPCTGELQFWAVMRSQMTEQTKQLARIAAALESISAALMDDDNDGVIQVGDTVSWTEPETGLTKSGWRVVGVPGVNDGEVDPAGVYSIVHPDGSAAKVLGHELTLERPCLG